MRNLEWLRTDPGAVLCVVYAYVATHADIRFVGAWRVSVPTAARCARLTLEDTFAHVYLADPMSLCQFTHSSTLLICRAAEAEGSGLENRNSLASCHRIQLQNTTDAQTSKQSGSTGACTNSSSLA